MSMIIPRVTKKIQLICPICKSKDIIGIPESKMNTKSQLITISIHKGLICPHHFQVFLDKTFQVRGYQKVDLELEQENMKILRNGVKEIKKYEDDEKELFETLVLKSNTVKYYPLNHPSNQKLHVKKSKKILNKKIMALKDIYEEFWEFIDNDNEEFQKFIVRDERRKNLLTNNCHSEGYTYLNLESKNSMENF
ncbi:MAG: hypothetical protein ACFE9T_01230 [Promethearchaeota archaeon]